MALIDCCLTPSAVVVAMAFEEQPVVGLAGPDSRQPPSIEDETTF